MSFKTVKLLQGLTSSARNEEFEEVLQFLKNGRHAHGIFKDPDAFFTDNCQAFSGSIKKIFPATRSMQDLAHIIYRVVETLLRTNPSFKHMVQLVKDCFYSKKEIGLSNGKKVQVTKVRPNDRIAEALKKFENTYKDKGVYNSKTFPSAVKNVIKHCGHHCLQWPDGVESYYFIDNKMKVKEKQGSSNCENTHRSMHSTFYRGPVGPETQQERFSSFFLNLNCKRGARNRHDPFLVFAGSGLTLRLPEVDRMAELLNKFFGKEKFPRWPKPPPNFPKFDFFMLLRTATKKAKEVCSSISDVIMGAFALERNDLARCLLPKVLKEEEEEPETSGARAEISNNFDDSSPSPLVKRKRQNVETAAAIPIGPQPLLPPPPPPPRYLALDSPSLSQKTLSLPPQNSPSLTHTKVALASAPFSTITTKSREGRAFLTSKDIAVPLHVKPISKFNAFWSHWNSQVNVRQAVTETQMRVLLKMFVDKAKRERHMQLQLRPGLEGLSSDSIDFDAPTDPAVAISMSLSRHGAIVHTDDRLGAFNHEEDNHLDEEQVLENPTGQVGTAPLENALRLHDNGIAPFIPSSGPFEIPSHFSDASRSLSLHALPQLSHR
ncbi:hypothetical protein BC829DRAFT_414817 [Chytridium lagenaria]|nr:hypothetical protein BC829DRAFT_414817 [Chytridium lagenaria]